MKNQDLRHDLKPATKFNETFCPEVLELSTQLPAIQRYKNKPSPQERELPKKVVNRYLNASTGLGSKQPSQRVIAPPKMRQPREKRSSSVIEATVSLKSYERAMAECQY